jgi:hypothetical protein
MYRFHGTWFMNWYTKRHRIQNSCNQYMRDKTISTLQILLPRERIIKKPRCYPLGMWPKYLFITWGTLPRCSRFALRLIQRLIHDFITSSLDYCNALLSGLPKKAIAQLQNIRNAAAQVLTKTRWRAHITLVYRSLHWLPVSFRIHLNILLLV